MSRPTDAELVAIDTFRACSRILPLSGVATIEAIAAEVRRKNGGWRTDEVVAALQAMEHCAVISSRSDREGVLRWIVPGPSWPSNLPETT